MKMIFESAAAEAAFFSRSGPHPRADSRAITASEPSPPVVLDGPKVTRTLIQAAEKNIGCQLYTADFSELLLDVALREKWGREKVIKSIFEAFLIVAERQGGMGL
jgi:hypothetical protein